MNQNYEFKIGDSKGRMQFHGGPPDHAEFARVTAEGEVIVNWELTEKAAKLKDPIVQSVAQMMIAIRDKTYVEK